MYFADNIGEISDKDIVSELVLELGRQRGRSNRQPEAENVCQNQGVSLVSTAHKLSKGYPNAKSLGYTTYLFGSIWISK